MKTRTYDTVATGPLRLNLGRSNGALTERICIDAAGLVKRHTTVIHADDVWPTIFGDNAGGLDSPTDWDRKAIAASREINERRPIIPPWHDSWIEYAPVTDEDRVENHFAQIGVAVRAIPIAPGSESIVPLGIRAGIKTDHTDTLHCLDAMDNQRRNGSARPFAGIVGMSPRLEENFRDRISIALLCRLYVRQHLDGIPLGLDSPLIGPVWQTYLFLDHDFAAIHHTPDPDDDDRADVFMPAIPLVPPMGYSFEEPDTAAHLLALNAGAMAMMVRTFAMLNASNVTIIDGGTTADRITNRKRSLLRIPTITHKVLRVQTGKRTLTVDGRDPDAGYAPIPLHLVRGHFRDYSKGRGLFGNPNIRRAIWVPPFVKGDPDHGAVTKDYELETGEDDA